MKTKVILVISGYIFFTSCNRNIKFDKAKWLQKGETEYPYRRAMLRDLTTNYKLKGLSYKQLLTLIGEPQEDIVGDSNTIYYSIFEDYGFDIDPVHVIDLVIKLNKDLTVKDFYVDDWKE
jgi:hypothetical protein